MNALTNTRVIAVNTFREATRGKILTSIVIIATLLIVAASCFGLVTIGDQARIVKDFGLFAVSVAAVGYAAISGSSLLEKELTRRTIYNVLSKSVERSHFVVGKFIGMFVTSSCLVVLITTIVVLLSLALEGTPDLRLYIAASYTLMEVALMCGVVIFFSSVVVTPILSGLLAFAVFLAGRSADYFLFFTHSESVPAAGKWLFSLLYYGLPNLQQINVANSITFGEPISLAHFASSMVYSLSYSGMLVVLSCIIFERKDFN